METILIQIVIMCFLLTFLWAEEVSNKHYHETQWSYWEEQFWWTRNFDADAYDESVTDPFDAVYKMWVSDRMSLAGWHPKYGAEGWSGV